MRRIATTEFTEDLEKSFAKNNSVFSESSVVKKIRQPEKQSGDRILSPFILQKVGVIKLVNPTLTYVGTCLKNIQHSDNSCIMWAVCILKVMTFLYATSFLLMSLL